MDSTKKELEALWAPWRIEYFERPLPNSDFMDNAAQTSDDAAHLVVARRKTAMLMMNRYPYSPGHLMVVPYRKTSELADLGDQEKMELWELVILAQDLLRKVVKAQGFNVGFNLGRCAGAGVPDHLHLHVVPRWEGDYNFMPVLADTRVLPEALDHLYEKLTSPEHA